MLCQCGCGNTTNVYRNIPNKFIYGHSKRGTKQTDTTRKKIGLKGVGRRHSQETKDKLSLVHKGKKKSKEAIAKGIKTKTGREPTYSPFIPDLIVCCKNNRWYCCNNKSGKHTTHAKVVYEYFFGPVPHGFHVHHKNGDASLLESDRPDNLMLLPIKWNLVFMPTLAEGFQVAEQVVTNLYVEATNEGSTDLFKDVCKKLIRYTEGCPLCII